MGYVDGVNTCMWLDIMPIHMYVYVYVGRQKSQVLMGMWALSYID